MRVAGLTNRIRGSIYDHVFDSPNAEVGGVLVGHRQTIATPIVSNIIPALAARETLDTLTFTHDAWAFIHQEMESKFPDLEIVGWYHSHPGHGVFLSADDLFIHHNFFNDGTSIAFVVDPLNGDEGVFGWRDGEVVQLSAERTLCLGIREEAAQQGRPPVAVERTSVGYPVAGYLVPASLGLLMGLLAGLLLDLSTAMILVPGLDWLITL
jgi:proteasome lid subunit RPN8/RPN11